MRKYLSVLFFAVALAFTQVQAFETQLLTSPASAMLLAQVETHHDTAADNAIGTVVTVAEAVDPLVENVDFGKAQTFTDSLREVLKNADTDPTTQKVKEKAVDIAEYYEENKGNISVGKVVGLCIALGLAVLGFVIRHFWPKKKT